MALQPAPTQEADIDSLRDSQSVMLDHAANELIFAVVGYVGSGTSTVADQLQYVLQTWDGGPYDVNFLKARDVIQEWAAVRNLDCPTGPTLTLDGVKQLQDLGDEMRRSTRDNAAVARALIAGIRSARATKTGVIVEGSTPVRPDGKPRAYILDSIRHPAEIELLRHVYQDAFVTIGIVCEESRRLLRITRKYADAGEHNARRFMERDAKAAQKHGQRVADAFHLADFFIDNTVERNLADGMPNKSWDIAEQLARLIKIITHSVIIRPTISETAMFQATGAAMRSACLSRQVGASLVDAEGNIIASGSNEVPKAGGGVYGQAFPASDDEQEDHRCAFRETGEAPYCSNTREQNRIIDQLIDQIPELKNADGERKFQLPLEIRKLRVGDLLEFSRAVHAEMDALFSAARAGERIQGTRIFVTTFPCHYCARHLGLKPNKSVAAGIGC